MRQKSDDIVLLEGNNELNVTMTPVVVPIAGSIDPGFIWYEGLAAWELVVSGREIPLNGKIHLAPGWLNESETNIVGHVDLSVTYPDGTEQTLSAVLNQDKEAAPGNGWFVQFEPFVSSQEGTYTLVATLSSAGQVLDSVTFELVAIPVTQFAYVSVIKRKYHNDTYDYFWVDVQNTGSVAGTCTLEFYTRLELKAAPDTEWTLRATVSHTLQPGEIKTFGDNHECLMRAYFKGDTISGHEIAHMCVKFIGEPGEIIWKHHPWA